MAEFAASPPRCTNAHWNCSSSSSSASSNSEHGSNQNPVVSDSQLLDNNHSNHGGEYSNDDGSSNEGVTEFMDHIHLYNNNNNNELMTTDSSNDFDEEEEEDSIYSSSSSGSAYSGRINDIYYSSLPKLSLEGLAQMLSTHQFQNILVLSGAGVSVSAGIPDFRSPGTGLYDNLQKYNLPHPEAVFDINFYRQNPTPFQSLAKEIWPGLSSKPTLTHYFIKLLQEKEMLLRNYTQNIDGLEILAGVDPERVIECHGHFRSAHCIDCKHVYNGEECKHKFLNESSVPLCRACGGYIKPSIVFFGEGLPDVFASSIRSDLLQCDLLLVMGTSLKVQPVALIPQIISPNCPRLLLNRELVGDFEEGGSWRDVFIPGDCDESVRKLCQLVGWEQELDSLFRLGRHNSPEEDAIIKCCSGTATADDDGVIPSVIRNAHADIITSEDNIIV